MKKWLALATLSLSFIVWQQEVLPQAPALEGVVFSFNEGFPTFSADSMRLMSFGYERVLSGLLWLRFLEQSPVHKVGAGEVSWVYLDLDAISTLDPDFMPVFHQAAIYLSVIIEDKKGAELLLQKGARLHPGEWEIFSHLGYHYQFELRDLPKAQVAYEHGAQLPDAPPILALLAVRLKEGAPKEESIRFLRGLMERNSDPHIRQKFEDRIKELQTSG